MGETQLMNKWTKGPWRVEKGAIIVPLGLSVEITAEHERVGLVYEGYSNAQEANAKLIAAAPAMYEALKRAKMLGIHEEFIDAAIQQAEDGNSEPLGPLG